MLGTGIATIMSRRQSRQLIPDRVTVLLTDQCNLKCPHCKINIKQKLKSLCRFRPSDLIPQVSLLMGLEDPLSGMNMGETAELLARELEISRKDQDFFSFLSHEKAILAQNKIAKEISPLYASNDDCINSPSGIVIKEDNGIRKDSTTEKLNRLRPIFDPRE
mgnify:CR=1 FL=1